MDIETLTAFFMWCTIVNGGLLTLSSVLLVFAQDWVYSVHSRWFKIPRETFSVVIYCFIGVFKIVYLVFNVVPYVALLIVG